MTNVIPVDYDGQPVRFNGDGWIRSQAGGTWLPPKRAVVFAH